MSLDIEEQYDRIYRYCYFKLHSKVLAEDITQETFLRYLEHYNCMTTASALRCLYTIARNLCVNEYRKPKTEPMRESISDGQEEEHLLVRLTVREALSKLTHHEQELLLLRYVNDVPVSVIGELFGLSRFSVYRRIASASKRFREELQRGEAYDGMEERNNTGF